MFLCCVVRIPPFVIFWWGAAKRIINTETIRAFRNFLSSVLLRISARTMFFLFGTFLWVLSTKPVALVEYEIQNNYTDKIAKLQGASGTPHRLYKGPIQALTVRQCMIQSVWPILTRISVFADMENIATSAFWGTWPKMLLNEIS
jgi:hypothetical protein